MLCCFVSSCDEDLNHEVVTQYELKIKPESLTVEAGEESQFQVELNTNQGSFMLDTNSLDWQIDDESIASIQNGLVKGLKPGKTNVHVKYKSYAADAQITITPELPAITLHTQKDASSKVLITIASEKEFKIDWGAGTVKNYPAGVYEYDKMIVDKIASDTIRIYGKSVVDLQLTGQKVDDITLTKTPKLKELRMLGNLLQTIDLSACPSLEFLNVAGNKLEKLDLSKNKALRELHCFKNSLTSLNLPEGLYTHIAIN